MPLNLVEEIKICEVGPRDGLQNEKRILTTEEKSVSYTHLTLPKTERV